MESEPVSDAYRLLYERNLDAGRSITKKFAKLEVGKPLQLPVWDGVG